MPNKLIVTLAAAAMICCGQAFAQGAAPDKTGRVPNINPNLPAAESSPAAHHKSRQSHAKKSKSSKKSSEPESSREGTPTGDDSAAPRQ